MAFNTLKFILFFPCVCLVTWLLPRRWRNMFLLVVSLAFYTMWRPVCTVFLLWVTGVSYLGARKVEAQGLRRKASLVACIVLLLGPLAFFKFLDPINAVALAALHALGLGIDFHGLNWVIPAGLSIYTLQAIGYVVDVRSGKVPREQSLLNHALYLSFFPTVLSGPINRSFDLMPQIRERRFGFNPSLAGSGARLVVWGMFLKVAVADRFSVYTVSVLAHAGQYNGFSLLFAQVCYLFQMYCDFAGYSYIAQGCGRLLGVDLKDNFRQPFFAMGAGEYWHRWHMALSGWMRDHVYIPLGGSHCSKARTSLNIMITFLATGCWHGGNIAYLSWGLYNGVLVVVSHLLPIKRWKRNVPTRVVVSIATFMLLALGLTFFQPNYVEIFTQEFTAAFGAFCLKAPVSIHAESVLWYMAFTFVVVMLRDVQAEWKVVKVSRPASLAGYIVIVMLILLIGVFDGGQFIYIRF